MKPGGRSFLFEREKSIVKEGGEVQEEEGEQKGGEGAQTWESPSPESQLEGARP